MLEMPLIALRQVIHGAKPQAQRQVVEAKIVPAIGRSGGGRCCIGTARGSLLL